MATLTLVLASTGEEFDADVDFSKVTPRQILNNKDLGLPIPETQKEWHLVKGSQVVDSDTTLEKLGFKDGDKAEIVAKATVATVILH